MRIETYEKAYLALGGASLVAALLVLLYTSVVMDIHLPSRSTQVDPQTVRTTPPFDQLGVRQTGPGQYEAVMLGQAWAFLPQEIRVPVGAEVTFT
ncbi:MAG: cytochrome c oxidase subunit II, partial [bacterium]